MRTRLLAIVGTVVLGAASSWTAHAQVPPPPPPSPTLWSFLGIPQAAYKLNAQMFNRRGNFPGLEKKPPLKAIADVANLKSDVPAIKAAAEIKQAEDLKPQKVKAIKYLATIGCGCYDKDEKVTKALLAAMEDCTEDVRLEAVRAISMAASSERCSNCKQRSCCNEKITAQLYKIAYELDDLGCYVEPSERVRAAAVEALGICCPSQLPITEEVAAPPVEGATPTGPTEGTGPTEAVPQQPQPQPSTAAAQPAPTVDPNNFLHDVSHQHLIPAGAQSSRRTARVQTVAVARPAASPASSGPAGEIRLVDTQRNLMHVHLLPQAGELRVGTRVRVLSPAPNGMVVTGEAEVIRSEQGAATVQAVGPLRVADITRGSVVVR